MYLTCQKALKRKDTSAASKSLLHRTARDFLPKTRQGMEEGKLIQIRVATR